MTKKSKNTELNDKLYESVFGLLQNTNNAIKSGKTTAKTIDKIKSEIKSGKYPDKESLLGLLEKFLGSPEIPNEILSIVHELSMIDDKKKK